MEVKFKLKKENPVEENNGTPLQHSCLENPMGGGALWAAVHGVTKSRIRLSDFTFTFHFHALEKEMATHSSVLAWRVPGTGEPGGLLSMGSHRVGHDWSDLVAARSTILDVFPREIDVYSCSSYYYFTLLNTKLFNLKMLSLKKLITRQSMDWRRRALDWGVRQHLICIPSLSLATNDVW